MTGNKQGLWVGAAVLVSLLAACGGDSGNDGAAQSGAGTKQIKAGQTEGNAQVPGHGTDVAASTAATDAAAPAAGGAENEAAGQQEAAKTDTRVTENGIRGERLANLLISNNTYRTYDDEPTWERDQPLLYTDPGRELSGPPPQGEPLVAPKSPDVFAYQYMESSNGVGSIDLGSQTFDIPGAYAEFSGGYEPLVSSMKVRIDDKDIIWSNRNARFKRDEDFKDGKLLLTLDKTVTVSTQPYHDVNPNERKVELSSDKTYELKVGQVIPYDTVLQRWADAEGNFTELFVQKGGTGNEVRICTNTDIKTVKRLTCNIWGENGDDLGTYVADDRSVHQKDAGVRYWRSLSKGALIPAPAGSSIEQQTDAAVSEAGVSGDMLATMLMQQVGVDSTGPDRKTPVSLKEAEGPFPATKLLADAADASSLTGYQRIESAEHVLVKNDGPKSYEFAVETRENKLFRGLSFKLGFSHEFGTLMTTSSMRNAFKGIDVYRGALDFKNAADSIEPRAELLNFGFNAKVQVWGADAKNDGMQMLHPDRPFSVHKGELFAYDKPLQRWSTTDGNIEMLVKKGVADNQASLCLKVALPFVKRTECSHWQLPSAEWKLGTPLTSLGLSVTDDRSVYPGESGERYWQTPLDALKPAQNAAEQPAAGQQAAAQGAGAEQPQAAAQ